MKVTTLLLVFVLVFSGFNSALAQTDTTAVNKIKVDYTKKGFTFSTADDNYAMHIQSQIQFRFFTPTDQSPTAFDDFSKPDETGFKIHRARLKIGGHAYKPWFKYAIQYDYARGTLLDFRVTLDRWDFFKVELGQWKTAYSRERTISSGKQQMMDRSIINRAFTIDRQTGVAFSGRVFPETLADFTYHVSVLTGTGRGATRNDDSHLMYVGRLQWNMFGRELEITGSDLKFHDKPTASLAFAAATNRSQFTRFSTSGGGNLEGYTSNAPGQYRINQGLIETAFKYRGFSWQHESHLKKITDYETNTDKTLSGYYLQAGYFFSNIADFVPAPLEVAGIFANYTPDTDFSNSYEQEYGVAFNWFFKEHRNKLTMEITRFSYKTIDNISDNQWRFRVQWDISF
ncbi:porin [Bizionia sediminis]|uniref:Porin n=1 Tax=Bizionia sediminis TaxID=1737064 RepID=A0ABW5KTB8_9FLAO